MRKILILFVVALIGFASCADSKQSMTVTVTNSLALERAGEMVEVPMSDVVAKLKLADTAQIVVLDVDGHPRYGRGKQCGYLYHSTGHTGTF